MTIKPSLIVTDVDNTLFDWVRYYTRCFIALLEEVEKITGVPLETLCLESKKVFEKYGSIEYPFLVQELPSVVAKCEQNVDYILDHVMEPARQKFLALSGEVLVPYDGVVDTLKQLKEKCPDAPIVALTDAPRYVAMWKMNKLGLLDYFDAVYGLPDPQIPTCEQNRRVKVKPGILLKHLEQFNFGYTGRIRVLPEEYEKPGTRGLRTVLMDFEMDKIELAKNVLWIGDNRRKDIQLGVRLGVQTIWAAYGAAVPPELMNELSRFSPDSNVQKNANVESKGESFPDPDLTIQSFADLLKHIS